MAAHRQLNGIIWPYAQQPAVASASATELGQDQNTCSAAPGASNPRQSCVPRQNTTNKGAKQPSCSPLAALQQLYANHTAVLPSYTRHAEDVTEKDITSAVTFRQHMDARVPDPQQVCCVCARCLPVVSSRGHCEVKLPHVVQTDCIPNLDLLRKDRAPCKKYPKDKFPRHGLTVCNIKGTEYCLDAAGVQGKPSDLCMLQYITEHAIHGQLLPYTWSAVVPTGLRCG
jgi:hypothetical protein